ncbi:MAG: hypothetical protein QNJ45_03080 [Ardenticatenaceae bacterium]|nr:hypothetical protein [Ardenticatenaceae bacterium]
MVESLVLTSLEMVESSFTRYELPPEGITSLGYVVRRMHKTAILADVPQMVEQGEFAQALSQIAYYAAAAAVSFGSLYYEPLKDEVGSTVTERDPETGALVTATLVDVAPNDKHKAEVRLKDGSRFSGHEFTSDSRFGVRGWVLPATTSFTFVSADESYQAECHGTISREVVPRIAGPWHSRALGSLKIKDSQGNVGHLTLQRNAKAIITVSCCSGKTILHREVSVS